MQYCRSLEIEIHILGVKNFYFYWCTFWLKKLILLKVICKILEKLTIVFKLLLTLSNLLFILQLRE
jgi:hypothetical protein